MSSSASTDPTPPWIELPREITASILHRLGAIEILTIARRVCTTWRSVCMDPAMWRSIDMRYPTGTLDVWYDVDVLCRRAVDQSQGQLVDINIEMVRGENLLIYISERCPQLKSLQLVHTYEYMSDEGWSKAMKRFPLLEELHLHHSPIRPENIETVGLSCPLLKSFKLNKSWDKWQHPVASDLDAKSIAESMPQLRHLQLIANQMSNEGLQAILDGCPNLESLDLRQCYNIHFGGNLAKECSQRIKDLRRPHDPLDDYHYAVEIYDHPTSDEDYITGYSDMDLVSDYEDYLEFSEGSMGSYDEYAADDDPEDVEVYDDDDEPIL